MIYVNARFLTQELTGVQRFAEQLSLSLSSQRDDLVFVSPDGIIRKAIAEKLNVQVIGKKIGHAWEQFELPKYLKKQGAPLLLNLCSTAPMFYKNQIVTHHDVTYKRYPKSFSRNFKLLYGMLVPLMLRNSHRLLTVSEFSKREISEFYGVNEDKISIIYNAVSGDFARSEFRDNKERYLLAVSSPNYHKNFHGMIEAFLKLEGANCKLKVIGKASTSFAAQDYTQLLKETGDIEFLGRVDDKRLVELYQNALAFVFPSFYEGFGIPPLEAQACGCPVISSNAASMPEVLTDSVIYFSPEDTDMMAEVMMKVIVDERLRVALINAGQENVKRFSWDASATKISTILDELSGHSR
ncbi:glycosyltransferase family 4 protein [Serratia grimesii]|uniref:glycosyltransferase family 4 protein n=1 Tax=Serratia grimesii TaxID=82995 RepID=UPI00223F50E9|nr:glycosyltransferase family 1 protein [Serratia grimesii]